jgi:hypothetical protein
VTTAGGRASNFANLLLMRQNLRGRLRLRQILILLHMRQVLALLLRLRQMGLAADAHASGFAIFAPRQAVATASGIHDSVAYMSGWCAAVASASIEIRTQAAGDVWARPWFSPQPTGCCRESYKS